MSKVPVIDISPFLSGGPDASRVVEAIDRACREVGFLVIEGHGFPERLLSGMRDTMLKFFEQSLDVKSACGVTPDNFHGYRGPNATALAKSLGYESPPDLMERFTVGRVDVPDDAYHRERRQKFFRDNRWPSDQPEFRETAQAYYRQMEKLASDLMRLFAAALQLPDNYFTGFFDKHISQLVTNYYPALDKAPDAGQLRAGAHTDYGSLTILNPAIASGGLQVMTKEGTWEYVPMIPGTFVINIGDMLAQWTNDEWVSTLHRVVVPEGKPKRAAAMSLVFFQQANDDALIRCLETCTSESKPPKYAPITAGDHVAAKLNKAWVGKKDLEGMAEA